MNNNDTSSTSFRYIFCYRPKKMRQLGKTFCFASITTESTWSKTPKQYKPGDNLKKTKKLDCLLLEKVLMCVANTLAYHCKMLKL